MDPRLYEEKAELSALCSMPGATPSRVLELFTVFGSPAAAWEAVGRGLPAGVAGADRADRWRRWAREVDPASRLRGFEAIGVCVVAAGEPLYPALLAETHYPPLVLYRRGELPDPLTPAVAVVGSRKATPYGLEVSRWFARELAERGIIVVSGAAYGIDSAAHRGALEAGGRTVSVLGCGPDIAYPRSNAGLFKEIEQSGCVLSEYPPGTRPNKPHFPARNRIIAGISLGVAVIEAAAGSGALLTAEFALSEGREVMAVPGGILSPCSAGTNGLIRNGAALVAHPDDILTDLGLLSDRLFSDRAGCARGSTSEGPDPGGFSRGPGGEATGRDGLFLEALTRGAADIEEMSRRVGATAAETMSALARLEVGGLVRRGAGGIYHPAARACPQSRPHRK